MTLLFVTLLSYCLLSPTVHATHYAFVKSGVTSDGIPIQEEDVYDTQYGIERVARIVGIQVHLHMHHPNKPTTPTEEAVPIQEGEVQAPMISPNIPMTIDDINVALSATFNNLRSIVPSDSIDFVNLRILVGKLEEKIEKCHHSEKETSSQHADQAQQDVEPVIGAKTAEPGEQPVINLLTQQQLKETSAEETSKNNKQAENISSTESKAENIQQQENEKDVESAAQAQITLTGTTENSPQEPDKESKDNKKETNESESEDEQQELPETVNSHKHVSGESEKHQQKNGESQDKQNEIEELKEMVEELVGNGTQTAESKTSSIEEHNGSPVTDDEPPILDKGINAQDVQATTSTEKEPAANNDKNQHDEAVRTKADALQQPHNASDSDITITIDTKHEPNTAGVDVHQRKRDSDETKHSSISDKQDEQANVNVMKEIINLADMIEQHEMEKQKTEEGIESLKLKGKDSTKHQKTSLNE